MGKTAKIMKTILRRIGAVAMSLIAILLVVVIAFGNSLANTYSGMITMFLGQSTVKMEGGSNPLYYESDYESAEDVADASAQICLDIEREGIVLMKNENNTLPLASGAKISLLSQNSVDLVYGGAGAGSVDASNAWDLKTALEATGFEVNPTLWEFYLTGPGAAYRKEVPNIMGGGNLAAHEVPRAEYTQEALDSMEAYPDAALVVIGRTGSESMDLSAEYLEFTAEELELLALANEKFDKVILVLNVTNAMNLSVLDEYEIDACIWIGALGQEGVKAVGEVLNGTVNPSGHLVDTWSKKPTEAPSYANLGNYRFANSTVENGRSYIVYAEGIYVGYRYYETRYEDVVMGNASASNYHYDEQVMFPFGYGLSYTTFQWSDYQVTENRDDFTVTVTVTNTGEVAGKEVVQVYLQNPYTEYDKANRIEKSAVELVGFGKTGLLAPGASETVTVTVDKDSMKVFDAYGYGTYIVEAGDYYLTAAHDAHEATNNILSAKGYLDGDTSCVYQHVVDTLDTTTYSVSSVTGNAITAQMSDADILAYDDSFTYLSRSDWEGTWPTTYANGSWTAPESLIAALEIIAVEETVDTMPLFDQAGDLKLVDLMGADFDDPRWEQLLSQMTMDETYDLIRRAGYGSMAVSDEGIPGTIAKDGPAGISSTLAGGNLSCMAYPPAVVLASTWNAELAEERGRMVGEDSLSSDVTVWYAPAMNIHRSAISGRNFEYYSEDGYLSGVFGAKEVAGFQSKGGIVTIKHFAINDQETNRIGGAMFVNEQAARQIYLKPFEMTVVEGGALGIMSSMNRVGPRWIGGHEGIMTNILRGEWGYEGFVITDQASFPSFNYCDIREGLIAGNDIWLNTAANMWILEEEQMTPTVMTAVRNAAHRYLYVVVNSNAMNGVDRDTVVKNVNAPWQNLLIAVDILVVLLALAILWKAVKVWRGIPSRRKRKKLEKKAKKEAEAAAAAEQK